MRSKGQADATSEYAAQLGCSEAESSGEEYRQNYLAEDGLYRVAGILTVKF
jgi:hypothetical protein